MIYESGERVHNNDARPRGNCRGRWPAKQGNKVWKSRTAEMKEVLHPTGCCLVLSMMEKARKCPKSTVAKGVESVYIEKRGKVKSVMTVTKAYNCPRRTYPDCLIAIFQGIRSKLHSVLINTQS